MPAHPRRAYGLQLAHPPDPMTSSRQLKLGAFMRPVSIHTGAWRYPGAFADANFNFAHLQRFAQTLERARFDAFFMADHLAVLNMPMAALQRSHTVSSFEPFTLLSALSQHTTHLGLVATASTTFDEPFHIARRFASLDHLSGGRAGWNIVTTSNPDAAKNFGRDEHMAHDERYARAREFYDVVTGLWDSWADDAIIDDTASGVYMEPARIHAIDYRGERLRVKGPLNVPASPQRHPVLFQAGSSADGQRFAVRYAEAVFTAQPTVESAQAFYRALKAQVVAAGRSANSLAILPGISAVVADSDARATQILAELNELTAIETGLSRLANRFGGYDFSALPLDRPLSLDDFPDPEQVQAAKSRAQVITDLVRASHPTLRELLTSLAGARGHFALAGSPERIADTLQHWFENGAADGFNLMPPILPAMLETFIDQVVPLLQARGLFRHEYSEGTLRERYGLARPGSRFFG